MLSSYSFEAHLQSIPILLPLHSKHFVSLMQDLHKIPQGKHDYKSSLL